MSAAFSRMASVLVCAAASISFARTFIAVEYSVIALHSFDMSWTSVLMSAALWFIFAALFATFRITVDREPESADSPFALSLEVRVCFSTSLVTSSSEVELSCSVFTVPWIGVITYFRIIRTAASISSRQVTTEAAAMIRETGSMSIL